MTAFLLISWVGIIYASYKVAIIVLKKTDMI